MDLKRQTNRISDDDGTQGKSSLLLPKIVNRNSILISNAEKSETTIKNKYGSDMCKISQVTKQAIEKTDEIKNRDKTRSFKTNDKLPLLKTHKEESFLHKTKCANNDYFKNEVNKTSLEIQPLYHTDEDKKSKEYDHETIYLPKLVINDLENENKSDIQLKTHLRSLKSPSINAFGHISKSKLKNVSHDKNRDQNIRENAGTFPRISIKKSSLSPRRVNRIDQIESYDTNIKAPFNELKSIINRGDNVKSHMKKNVVRFSKFNNHYQIEEMVLNSQFTNSFVSNLSDEERSLRKKSHSRKNNDKEVTKYRFDFKKAENIIEEVLENFALGHYSNELKNKSIGETITYLSDTIKERIKEISDKRHKLVVLVTFYTQDNQGIIIASKCFWDNQNDSSVTVRQNYQENYVIVATLYAIL